MGYYTAYTLKVKDENRNYFEDNLLVMWDIAWQFEKITQWFGCETYDEFVENYRNEFEKFGFNGLIFDDIYKWYDHEENMIELSKKFPSYLFILEGHGEDYDDVWRHYFLNGKDQYTHATLKFDECYLG